MSRRILLVTHPRRPEVLQAAAEVAARLADHDIDALLLPDEAAAIDVEHREHIMEADPADPARGCELVCVLGGDGTILRGAEVSRGSGAPLLGINLGRVGFLAEAEAEEISETVERIVARDYTVEERVTLEVEVIHEGRTIATSWALNEASVEKWSRERMLELTVEIDGLPLSTWGCDGVVMATPTGSTAYAFSAGGPVVWPDVAALLVVPISAHALFARPLVLGPDSRLAVEVLPDSGVTGVMWCDGRRTVDLPPGARIEVRRSEVPVRLARVTSSPFTNRLVAKFDLSVEGWRGRPRPASDGGGEPGRTDRTGRADRTGA